MDAHLDFLICICVSFSIVSSRIVQGTCLIGNIPHLSRFISNSRDSSECHCKIPCRTEARCVSLSFVRSSHIARILFFLGILICPCLLFHTTSVKTRDCQYFSACVCLLTYLTIFAMHKAIVYATL